MNIADLVTKKRERMGLTQRGFAMKLGLGPSGERTVRGWESGQHRPSAATIAKIESLSDSPPFKTTHTAPNFKFIDLFAGIGGIRLPFQELGGECVFTSEWDKFAQDTYQANFGERPFGDITEIAASAIPDHDVLLAGFPCQAFSSAGLRQGFSDTRGTMFFEIQRILAAKRPAAFLLENVKQLRSHDGGRTLKTILDILRGESQAHIPDHVPMSPEARASLNHKLNYDVDYRVLRAVDFGVPQNRERIYIVGFDRKRFPGLSVKKLMELIKPTHTGTKLGDILFDNKTVDPKYTMSDRLLAGHIRRMKSHQERGNGFGYSIFGPDSPYCNTLTTRYYKDGREILIDQTDVGQNPRKLTPRECARVQGFPEQYDLSAASDVQLYRQFGNSVSVPVIREIANVIAQTLNVQSEEMPEDVAI